MLLCVRRQVTCELPFVGKGGTAVFVCQLYERTMKVVSFLNHAGRLTTISLIATGFS